MKATLYTKEGKKKSEVVLNAGIFSARVNERLLELVLNAYGANKRHGTHDTKTRKEVRGGGKKPWKQKGTGRARHGSIRSPIWRGGGTTFGPHPRKYTVNLPKTMKLEAIVSALSFKGQQKNLMLLEGVKLNAPKTKEWMKVVNALPLDGKKTLCIVKDLEANLKRASANAEGFVKVRKASDVNAYDIMRREKLIISEDALPVIESRLVNAIAAEVEK